MVASSVGGPSVLARIGLVFALSLPWQVALHERIAQQDSTALITSMMTGPDGWRSAVVPVQSGTVAFPQQGYRESGTAPIFATGVVVAGRLAPVVIGASGEMSGSIVASGSNDDPAPRVNRLAKADSLVPPKARAPGTAHTPDAPTHDIRAEEDEAPQVNVFTFAFAYSNIDERLADANGFARPLRPTMPSVPVSAPPPERHFPHHDAPAQMPLTQAGQPDDGTARLLAMAPRGPDLGVDQADITGSIAPVETPVDKPVQAALAPVPLPKPAPRPETTAETFARLGTLSIRSSKELERAQHCLTEAIYFESRGEPEQGQRAVAQVVLNRVRSGVYPSTVCDVIYQNAHRHNKCQFSYLCDGSSLRVKEPDAWRTAQRIAAEAINGKSYVKEVGASTHYHADWVHPTWRHELERTRKIGIHIFYKMPNVELRGS